MPRVSIILPSSREAPYLAASIESVHAQTFNDWELIIVDDGLSNTARIFVSEIVRKNSRVRLVGDRVQRGIQRALNCGIQESRGEYIARIDDDDVWVDPEKLARQIEFLDKNPQYVLVGTGAIIVDVNNREMSRYRMPEHDSDIRRSILSKNCFLHSSVVFRKRDALISGGYDESIRTRHIEDYDLWLKLGLQGKFSNLPTYAVALTVHPGSLTSKNRPIQAWRAFRRMMVYRRRYPRFIKGFCISFLRFTFFVLQKILPIKGVYEEKIKSFHKRF